MKHGLIQVKYRNSQEGFVDDVTLNELILSRKIKHFYRPSQEKWIDIETDPVRIWESQYGGPERRKSDKEEGSEQLEEKPRGLLSRLSRGNVKPIAPKKALTAEDWFDRGFLAFHNEDDAERALRAFAKSIHLDQAYLKAYFNRGITYERVGNLQQAIDDYSKAIELAPGDAKVYYVRGLARKHLGMDDEAIEDLEKAARMGYRQADVTAVTPARGEIPSFSFPRTEKAEMPDMVTLRHRSVKSPSLEKIKRKNSFSVIVSMGVYFALVSVIILRFIWPTILPDATKYVRKIYLPRINEPTVKSVMVPPLEDTKLKSQTENLSVSPAPSSVTKEASADQNVQPATTLPIEEKKLKDQTEEISPAAPPKVTKNGKYAIQIIAHPEARKKDAVAFAKDLSKTQPDVYVERVNIRKRGVWYRILLGHFANIEEASTYMKEKKVFKSYTGM